MKLYLWIISSLLFGTSLALHNCSSFNDRNHGFGCELRNVQPEDEILEITLLTRDNDSNKTDEDITWVQIRDSKFVNLPKGVFEKFINMEKIMILGSTGFKNLSTPYFDKKITLVLMKNTDMEVIGENPLKDLTDLKTLSLNYNQITSIHKNAFRDLVKMEKIEMVANKIDYLDADIFRNNVNLKLVLLYHNQLKVIPAQLFARNNLLESLQLQNNSISQIEKNFHTSLSKLTKADFSTNVCISETISITRFIQWNSHMYKFKDCFNNYALMKSTNEVIDSVRGKMADMEERVNNMLERVDNDLTVLEGKLKNTTELETFKTNLLNFFELDKKTFEAKYEKDLNNITSHVRTELTDEIKKNVVEVLEKSQDAKQSKLVSEDFEQFRDTFSGKFNFIYFVLFMMVLLMCGMGLIVARSFGFNTFYQQSDTRKLIDPEA